MKQDRANEIYIQKKTPLQSSNKCVRREEKKKIIIKQTHPPTVLQQNKQQGTRIQNLS